MCVSSCLVYPTLVFQDVCLGGACISHWCVLFIHLEMDISAALLPSKGGFRKPRSTIFGFTPKHAHSYHLCADQKWVLHTLLTWALKSQWFYLPASLLKTVFIGLPRRKTINNRSSLDLVWLIDQDWLVLVCSSEPVFEFVLGRDPGRLVRVTGKLQSQPDP